MRPVFLWADESQNFIARSDSGFLNEAREAKAAVVYLTQGLPNYDAVLGRDRTRSMLNSLGTKVFHALGDADTIRYVSELVGQHTKFKKSIRPTEHNREQALRRKSDTSYSEQLENILGNSDFFRLAKGRGVDGVVEAIVVQSGRTWLPDNEPSYLWRMYRRR